MRTARERDGAVESWLRQEVVRIYDAIKADPSQALTPAEAQASLAAEYERSKQRR